MNPTIEQAVALIDPILRREETAGAVYWFSAGPASASGHQLRPQSDGAALACTISKGGNEGHHLQVLARVAADPPPDAVVHPSRREWVTLRTAKVWTLEDAARIAGELLAAAVAWSIEAEGQDVPGA